MAENGRPTVHARVWQISTGYTLKSTKDHHHHLLKSAYPWGVAGAASGVEPSTHLGLVPQVANPLVGLQGETNQDLQRNPANGFWDGLEAFGHLVLNTAAVWLFYPGSFVSRVHTNKAAIFPAVEAVIRCLGIHKYPHF